MKAPFINIRYLPTSLTKKDRKKQSKMLLKSRRLYKKGKYYTRKRVVSFTSKKSPHILKATKMYNVDTIGPTNELAKATGCSKEALAKIINKGEGAYYSSGSRPNQTSQSWGIARLASSITAGKAAALKAQAGWGQHHVKRGHSRCPDFADLVARYAAFCGFCPTCKATRSVTVTPQPRIISSLRGLLVIRRIAENPMRRRISAPMRKSRSSSSKPRR